MSYKNRKPNKRKRGTNTSKPATNTHSGFYPRSVTPGIENQPEPQHELEHEQYLEGDRFLLVNEIAQRCGVGATAVRKWNREGKLPLRKLFGATGPYGMPESQFVRLIRGEGA